MLHIAVVDDNPADIERIKTYLVQYFKKRSETFTDYSIRTFQEGQSFLTGLTCGAYDLIFLDIYMPRMTGIQVAQKVRTVDEGVKILFLTTSKDHALESYSVFAAGYVLKPIDENHPFFESLLNRLLPDDKISGRSLSVRLVGQQSLEIPFSRILYIDCGQGRNGVIHLKEQEIPTANTYQELADQLLSDERFLECYHRLLINMDYVTSMEEEQFHLSCGCPVPISRRKKKEVKHLYLQYLLKS